MKKWCKINTIAGLSALGVAIVVTIFVEYIEKGFDVDKVMVENLSKCAGHLITKFDFK